MGVLLPSGLNAGSALASGARAGSRGSGTADGGGGGGGGGGGFTDITDIGWAHLYWAENEVSGSTFTDSAGTDDLAGVSSGTISVATSTSFNGKKVATTATGYFQVDFAATITPPYSVVMVARHPLASPNIYMTDGDSAGVGRCIIGNAASGAYRVYMGADRSISTNAIADTVSVHGWTVVSNGASSKAELNGHTLGSGTVGTQNLPGFTLGAAYDGGALQAGMEVAFVGIYDGDITADPLWADFQAWVASYYQAWIGSAWKPTDLANLELWLAADAAESWSSIAGFVIGVTDLAGSYGALSVSGSPVIRSNTPSIGASQRTTVNFPGGARLNASPPPHAEPNVYAALEISDTTPEQHGIVQWLNGGNTNAQFVLRRNRFGVTDKAILETYDGSFHTAQDDWVGATGNPQLVYGYWDGTDVHVLGDSPEATTTLTPSHATDSPTAFNFGLAQSRAFVGHLYEIIVTSGAESPTDAEAIIDYLTRKWGL